VFSETRAGVAELTCRLAALAHSGLQALDAATVRAVIRQAVRRPPAPHRSALPLADPPRSADLPIRRDPSIRRRSRPDVHTTRSAYARSWPTAAAPMANAAASG
jgi:hypothetical protein